MKKLPFYLLFVFAISISNFSCSNESIEEIIAEEETDPDPDGDTDTDPDSDTDTDPVNTDDPCSFDLSDATANSTITIDCILDLEGNTINLPSNVNFDFEGGDIRNGKLVFSGGYIDYRIMNSSLTLEGDVRLKEPTFEFLSSRWDIVQGRTTEEIAQKNKKILQDLLNQVKAMEGTTFKIDKLDAYFDVGSEDRPIGYTDARDAITVPGDFTLKMTDNTHLRVQPNFHIQYTLMAVTDGASNILIEGGHLYGDREEHDYNRIQSTHEWGHVFMVAGATNVTLRGITMKYGSGDGLDIRANVNSNIEGHVSSTNILVEQCTFDSNRRNNVSITDGNDIKIDNNLFLRAGIDMPNSRGTAPRYGLDIEEVYFEEAYDITISNNTEREGANGSFLVAIGYDVTIEGNTVETPMGYAISNGTTIRNNKLVANAENAQNGTAIFCGRNDTDEIFNNQVYGNEVIGFSTGIFAVNKDLKIHDNIITDCKSGIRARGLIDSEIYGNTINSTHPESIGISADMWLNNVTIDRGNTINVRRQPFRFTSLNKEANEENYTFTIEGNTFNSTSTANISNTEGIIFKNNSMNTGIELFNSAEITFDQNTITPANSNGIHLRDVNNDIVITDNTIEVNNSSFECIKIDASTNSNEVQESNNSCALR